MSFRRANAEPTWVRWLLTAIALGFLALFLGLPLIAVFVEAFAAGVPTYLAALAEPETGHAVLLSLLIALVVLPFNVLFGVAAAGAGAALQR